MTSDSQTKPQPKILGPRRGWEHGAPHPYTQVGNFCWYCREASNAQIHNVVERRGGRDRRRG